MLLRHGMQLVSAPSKPELWRLTGKANELIASEGKEKQFQAVGCYVVTGENRLTGKKNWVYAVFVKETGKGNLEGEIEGQRRSVRVYTDDGVPL